MSGSDSVIGKRGDGNGAGERQAGAGEAAARLDRLVAEARAVALWEAAWPLLWRSLAVVLISSEPVNRRFSHGRGPR